MKYNICFVGCGNMGGALLNNVANKSPNLLIAACDKTKEKSDYFEEKYKNVTSTDTITAIKSCKYIVLGVKPQFLSSLSDEIRDVISQNKDAVLISMAAGTSIEKIRSLFSFDLPVIRIMPNTPASIGKGIILYSCSENVSEQQKEEFLQMFSGCGIIDNIPENLIDAASAVTGCGPAFAYIFIEALADGAVRCGIARDKAIKYASAMLSGSAELVLSTGKHPELLKDEVCSPGGTTIAGVQALEDHGFRAAAISAVSEAYKRTLELK